MKLILSNPVFQPSFRLEHQHQLFFIGSCFAESMSSYFIDRKFKVRQNPFGILFNPISISDCIEHIVNNKSCDPQTFYEQDGLVSSWNHHSNLSEQDPVVLKEKLEGVNTNANTYLNNTDVVFITLGTAWVYWHKELQRVVANNLKAPAHLFEKRLLEIDEISSALKKTIDNLRAKNSGVKIVFTVSPVRHSKQGLVENNRSKARLLEAVHQICGEDNKLTYFPSYELVIDVLRDYRFYGKDFVHPNNLATDYIWNFLSEHFIQETDLPLLDEIYKVRLAMKHKLRSRESEAGREFIKLQLARISLIEDKRAYLDFKDECNYFERL